MLQWKTSAFFSRHINPVSVEKNYCRAFSRFKNFLGFGSLPQIRHASNDADKGSPKDKNFRTLKEYRPTVYDPYRMRKPDLELKPMAEFKAKAALECKGERTDPCTENVQHIPPKPKPVPCPPVNWQPYLLALAIVFGAGGLLYRAYEQRMANYFILNSTKNWKPRKVIRSPAKTPKIPKKTQYLIIGAGTAGVAAYNAIIERDKKAMIMFMSEEDTRPYCRPELSKGLWTNSEPINPEKLSFKDGRKERSCYYLDSSTFMDPQEFAELEEGPAVTISLGWPVNRVDADEHLAYVGADLDAVSIEYEKCLIATGSMPESLRFLKIMPQDVNDRICRLRTVRDLEAAFAKLNSAKKVVVVGDGSLALELAYSLKHLSEYADLDDELKVTLLVAGSGIFTSIIPDYLAQWAAEWVKAEGITVVTQSEVLDCYTTEKSLTVFLSSGEEVATDYVFLAIGAIPRTDIAESSFLEVDKERGGFVVNAELMARTDLYVAGDCASIYDLNHDRVRYDHYNSACDSGCIAGQNMTGSMKPFTRPTSYTIKCGTSLLLQGFGETNPTLETVGVFTTCTVDQTQKTVDKRPPVPRGEEPCYKRTDEYRKKFQKGVVFYLRDHMVTGLVLWNMKDKDDIAMEILSKKPMDEDIEELVKELEIHEENCCN